MFTSMKISLNCLNCTKYQSLYHKVIDGDEGKSGRRNFSEIKSDPVGDVTP